MFWKGLDDSIRDEIERERGGMERYLTWEDLHEAAAKVETTRKVQEARRVREALRMALIQFDRDTSMLSSNQT